MEKNSYTQYRCLWKQWCNKSLALLVWCTSKSQNDNINTMSPVSLTPVAF